MFYAALGSIAFTYSIWAVWEKVLNQYLHGLSTWNLAVWAAGILLWFVALMLASGIPCTKNLEFTSSGSAESRVGSTQTKIPAMQPCRRIAAVMVAL
jgi:hypothetical protein